MDKKNVYFFQVNMVYGNTMYLPYSAGVIAAYSFADDTVRNNYNLSGIFCKREPVEDAVSRLEKPAVAAFSNYIWNYEYNCAAARRIKELFPECVIVFGGHSVSKNNMQSTPFVDVFIRGEGERTFLDFLHTISSGGSLSEIGNVSYFDDGGKLVHNADRSDTAVEYLSPYLSGLFDGIIKDNPDILFSAILETNRGCPYHCSYCDWCSLSSRIKEIPLESVVGDLEWMAANKIEFCYCADANFGILRRDEMIVGRLTEIYRKTGYPKKFRVNYAKHNNETVLRINRELNKYGLSRGVTLSFQSMSDEVLENIGRKNIDIGHFKELMMLYYSEGIPTYSELILGLPGETYDSFCDGIGELLDAGQHSSVMIYNCELLENSEMATEGYQQRFGIRSAVTPVYLRHDLPSKGEVPEYSHSIISTYSMSPSQWVRANMFAVLVQSCHAMGLLQCIAVYLHYEKGVGYADFYKGLQDWCEKNFSSVPGTIYAVIRRHFEDITENKGSWSYINPVFGEVSWPYEEAFFLEAIYRLDDFYRDLSPFTDGFFDGDKKLGELKRYQHFIIKKPGMIFISDSFMYDFPSYFNGIYKGVYLSPAENRCKYYAEDKAVPDSWEDFAVQNVWFGRNDQRMLFTDVMPVSDGGAVTSGEKNE